MIARQYIALTVFACCFFIGSQFTRADEKPAAPFVAAFERFVQHDSMPIESGGRLLVSELSCTACHQTEATGMQAKRGPHLNNAGGRLRTEWVKAYLLNPQKVKPGATMPNVLAKLSADERQAAATALAAYLQTQTQPFPKLKATGRSPITHEFWKHGDAQQGAAIYHQVGCIACHEADADYETADHPPTSFEKMLKTLDADDIKELGLSDELRPVRSIPHADLAKKYTAKSLTFFLLDPLKSRHESRMPNFQLQPLEAADLVAYLQRNGSEETTASPVDSKLAARGKELFASLQCNSCHTTADFKYAPPAAKRFAALDFTSADNCISQTAKTGPRFELSKLQKTAISKSLESETTPQTSLELQLAKSNCYACHERNDIGGVGWGRRRYFETVRHVDLGDEGRLPPSLTHVGAKFNQTMLAKVLAGAANVRPHLKARMPVFAKSTTAPLPALFAKVDEANTTTAAAMFGELNAPPEAGRALIDTGCIQCHSLRGESLPGVVGVDLAGVTSRVHPDWFRQFLLNPAKLKKRTRMPTFFPEGKSSNPKLLDGDVDRQIASLWNYLHAGEKAKLPDKILAARSQDFELIPKEKPILLRTFMKDAGTHAIAVGFPDKVHYSFDAEKCRLVNAWRGRFLDAYGTWFVRFTPPADPLGGNRIEFPAGVLFTKDDWERSTTPKYEFKGYEFDKDRIPTYFYQYGDFEVKEYIKPHKGSLFREFEITNGGDKKPRQLILRIDQNAMLMSNLRNDHDDILVTTSGDKYDVFATSEKTKITDTLFDLKSKKQQKEIAIRFEIVDKAKLWFLYTWKDETP